MVTTSLCGFGLGVIVFMPWHLHAQDCLELGLQNGELRTTSLFKVPDEVRVGFNQNSEDTAVLLKKYGIVYMYTYVSLYSMGATCTYA